MGYDPFTFAFTFATGIRERRNCLTPVKTDD